MQFANAAPFIDSYTVRLTKAPTSNVIVHVQHIEERVFWKRLAKVSTGIPLRKLLKINCFVLGSNGPFTAGNNA